MLRFGRAALAGAPIVDAAPGLYPGIEESGGHAEWASMPDGARLRLASWVPPADRPGRGTAILLNGRTEFIEKQVELAGDLADRGFVVWTLDWRGQGLSHRPLRPAAAGHIDRFETYLEDLGHVLAQIRDRAPRPWLLVGHSMGGHLALRHLAAHPDDAPAAVALAPMIAFNTAWLPRPVAQRVADVAVRAGWARRPVTSDRAIELLLRRFPGNPLTSDPVRFRTETWWIERRPELSVTAPTFGWVDAAFRSVAQLRRHASIPRLGMPVLFLLGGRERIVSNPEIRRFAADLPRAELVTLADGRHELYRERDPVRAALWAAIDDFLGRHWPG